ncbi:MAG: TIGR03617 family F420-dependent LLM class oxidoreductase [Acidimicrobiales bacterium]
MKLDTQLWGLRDAPERARELAAVGLDGVFTFEGPHDVFTPLVLAAPSTTLDLYTNAAIALPRNPIQLAHQAWDLQALSEGRFALGLASQVRAQIERRYGTDFHPPLGRMRELVAALRAIFDSWQHGARLDFRGDYYTHTLMPPLFNPGPLDVGPPPIWLGGLGPKMVEMAATVADGLLVMPFCTERFFTEHTLVAVDRGLAASQRTRDDFAIVCESIICCGRDEAEMAAARDGVRMLLSFYGSTPAYRPVLDAHGWGELQGELNAMTKANEWDRMPDLVDDEMLATLAVCGTPDEVADQLVRRFDGVATRVGFYFPYAIPDDCIAAIVSSIRTKTGA